LTSPKTEQQILTLQRQGIWTRCHNSLSNAFKNLSSSRNTQLTDEILKMFERAKRVSAIVDRD